MQLKKDNVTCSERGPKSKGSLTIFNRLQTASLTIFNRLQTAQVK